MPKRESWRNRITGHGDESPTELIANPSNWRRHPKRQADALAGVLNDVGWVQDVIVNKQTGHLVDGHLRVALAVERKEPTIPVVYVDLSESEEALILATLDPLSAMAETDAAKLRGLLDEVSTGEQAVQEMLATLSADAGIVPDFQPVGIDEQGRLDQKARVTCPECGCEFVPKA
jgi:ParB-like chromosome segregation protein Spo0J